MRTHQVMTTLSLAELGFYVASRPREAVTTRTLLWRRILHELPRLGPQDLLEIAPGTNGSAGEIVVQRIEGNARTGTTYAISVDRRLRASARLAQRIEMAVRSGQRKARGRAASLLTETLSPSTAFLTPSRDLLTRATGYSNASRDRLREATGLSDARTLSPHWYSLFVQQPRYKLALPERQLPQQNRKVPQDHLLAGIRQEHHEVLANIPLRPLAILQPLARPEPRKHPPLGALPDTLGIAPVELVDDDEHHLAGRVRPALSAEQRVLPPLPGHGLNTAQPTTPHPSRRSASASLRSRSSDSVARTGLRCSYTSSRRCSLHLLGNPEAFLPVFCRLKRISGSRPDSPTYAHGFPR